MSDKKPEVKEIPCIKGHLHVCITPALQQIDMAICWHDAETVARFYAEDTIAARISPDPRMHAQLVGDEVEALRVACLFVLKRETDQKEDGFWTSDKKHYSVYRTEHDSSPTVYTFLAHIPPRTTAVEMHMTGLLKLIAALDEVLASVAS